MATETTAITFTTTIDYNSQTITFQDTSPTYGGGSGALGWAEADNAFITKLELGTDTVYNNTSGTSPDATGTDASFTTSLQTDADGNIVNGEYKVTLTYFNVSDTGLADAYFREYVFNVSYVSPTHDIDISHSVINPIFFKSVDNTTYTSNAVTPTITRDHRLYYPSAIGGYNQVTTKTLNTSLFYTGTSEVYLKSTLSYTFTDGYYSNASSVAVNFTLTDIITSRVDYIVSGVTSSCDFYCSMKEVYDNYYDNKTTNVGRANKYLSKYEEASLAWQMLTQSINCGKSVDMQTYVDRLNNILGDACNCSDSTSATQVVGIGTVTNIERVYSRTATVSPTASYTFTLADAVTGSSTSTNAALVGFTYNKDFIVLIDGIADIGGSFNSATGVYTFGTTLSPNAIAQAIIIRP